MNYFQLNCNHSITSIASDKEGKLLAVGGRDCINYK